MSEYEKFKRATKGMLFTEIGEFLNSRVSEFPNMYAMYKREEAKRIEAARRLGII